MPTHLAFVAFPTQTSICPPSDVLSKHIAKVCFHFLTNGWCRDARCFSFDCVHRLEQSVVPWNTLLWKKVLTFFSISSSPLSFVPDLRDDTQSPCFEMCFLRGPGWTQLVSGEALWIKPPGWDFQAALFSNIMAVPQHPVSDGRWNGGQPWPAITYIGIILPRSPLEINWSEAQGEGEVFWPVLDHFETNVNRKKFWLQRLS